MTTKTLTPCECGCGELVTRHFRQGHDAKLKSVLLLSARDGNNVAWDELVRRSWMPGTGLSIDYPTLTRQRRESEVSVRLEAVRQAEAIESARAIDGILAATAVEVRAGSRTNAAAPARTRRPRRGRFSVNELEAINAETYGESNEFAEPAEPNGPTAAELDAIASEGL